MNLFGKLFGFKPVECEQCKAKLDTSVFKEWTTIFPGKCGISWKRSWYGVGTKAEAEAEAAKNCNVIAVPLQLAEKISEHEQRMVIAENKLSDIKFGHDKEYGPKTPDPEIVTTKKLELHAKKLELYDELSDNEQWSFGNEKFRRMIED